jgi:hypothetical protein
VSTSGSRGRAAGPRRESDTSPTAASFKAASGLSTSPNAYNGQVWEFTSGALKGQRRTIQTYSGGGNPTLTFYPGFPGAPASGDKGLIV